MTAAAAAADGAGGNGAFSTKELLLRLDAKLDAFAASSAAATGALDSRLHKVEADIQEGRALVQGMLFPDFARLAERVAKIDLDGSHGLQELRRKIESNEEARKREKERSEAAIVAERRWRWGLVAGFIVTITGVIANSIVNALQAPPPV